MNQIRFHQVTKKGPLVDSLKAELDMSEEHATFLIELGAVYVDSQRAMENQQVLAGQILRLHQNPKRYASESIDWRGRVIEENNDYLAINKPCGIPVGPALDNFKECCLYEVCKSVPQAKITTRLDVPTSGVLVFAKTNEFQTEFNNLVSEGRVRKEYFALTVQSPQCGVFTHYMKKSKRAPREVTINEGPDSKICKLEIKKVARQGEAFRSDILLLTGRTHQIRAQYQALGHSIINDKMYGGEVRDAKDWIALHCKSLTFSWRAKEVILSAAEPE